MLASASLFAQSASPQYFVGAGLGSTPKALSSQTGWATFATKVSEGLYNTTALDILSGKTSIRTGVEKRLYTVGKLTVLAKADGGVTGTSSSFGLSGATGASLLYNTKGRFYLVVSASMVKSSFDPLSAVYRAGVGITIK